MTVPVPSNEEHRIRVLKRLEVLDTPPEAAFDRITSIASAVLGTPIALVSLVDESRQWFKSRVGLDAEETPREIAFCAHAICGEEVFQVTDASADPRFSDNPLVTDNPNIRFYAGAPLTAPGGANLGTLCVIDREPRELSEEQKGVLTNLAGLVVRELELRKAANSDPLTGASNRGQFMRFGECEWSRAQRFGHPLTVLLLDIDHFKKINDTYGHDAGDEALRAISAACRKNLRRQDLWARLGGEEFAVLLIEAAADEAHLMAERLRKAVSKLEIKCGGKSFGMTTSIGLAAADTSCETLEDALRRADEALYRAKEAGRNRVGTAIPASAGPATAKRAAAE